MLALKPLQASKSSAEQASAAAKAAAKVAVFDPLESTKQSATAAWQGHEVGPPSSWVPGPLSPRFPRHPEPLVPFNLRSSVTCGPWSPIHVGGLSRYVRVAGDLQ